VLLEAILEPGELGRHLLARLAADDERHEQLPDAVAGEVDPTETRDRFAPIGSTVTSTAAGIGPSMPRTLHVRGVSTCTSCDVDARSAPPMRRTEMHRAPTPVSPPSM
jgi:hypothetical protein